MIITYVGVPAEIVKYEIVSRYIMEYTRYLKEMYLSEPIMQEDPWPPPPSEEFTKLTLILKTKNGNDSDEQIDLENIFEDLEKPFKILIDGDPGSGKSTLCRKIVHNWSKKKMAQDFNLTVLVPLRDPEIVNSNRIDDLFYHDDSVLQMKVVEHVRKNQGANVLLIMDGYDELSHKQRTKHSLFLQILQGKKLAKCSVLVTSRPHASQKLESLHTLSQHVKLLGFSKRDIMSCISSSIHGEKGKKLQYLLRFEKLELLKVCENPLSCAIIIFVYKQENYDLPLTLTGTYEYFISNVLTREADIQGIECKSMLEPDLLNLCKLAYENSINDRVVLEDEEVRKLTGQNFKSLGLLTASKGFMSRGRKLNYAFTHLTVQEYLAAKWVHETLSPLDASNFLACNVMDDRFRYILLFLAGQSKLHHQSYEHFICDKQLDLCTFEETTDHKAFVTKIMFIYEAQNIVLCPLLSSLIKGRVLKIMASGINEKLSASLAFFIDKSCCTWEVVNLMLVHSNFVQFVSNFKSTNKLTIVKSFVLNHEPIITDYGCCTINDINRLLCQDAFCNVNSLSVTSPVDEKECAYFYVEEKQSAMFLRMLIMMGNIQHLSLQGVVGATNDTFHDLIGNNMNYLESLDIKSSQQSLEILWALGFAVRGRLQVMKSLSLQVLLPSEIEHKVDTRLGFTVKENFFNLDSLILRSCWNTKDLFGSSFSPTLSNFLYGIAMNHTLQRVTLGDMDLNPKGVCYILQNNHTLHTFNLVFVELTKKLISSLSIGLKKNKTLRSLCLIDFQDRTVGVGSAISFAITNARTVALTCVSDLEMDIEAKPENPYHLLLDSIVTSKLQSVVLDFEPGKFSFNSAKFFKHLIRMLIKDKTLTRFTLYYSYYSEEHLAEIARALVISGKRNEIDFTLGNSLTPSIYSRFSHSPTSILNGNRRPGDYQIPIVQDQELLIQQKVDEFKDIMLKNMLKTLVFILAIRKQKQNKILEQLSFDLLTYSILKVLHKRIHRQTVFLDIWKETRMLRSLLNTLSFILMLRKQRQQVFLDTLRYHVMYIPE